MVNKGLPERRTLSTSAPVILLTIRTGAVSPVSSGSSARVLSSHFPTAVYGLTSQALMSPTVGGGECEAPAQGQAGRSKVHIEVERRQKLPVAWATTMNI